MGKQPDRRTREGARRGVLLPLCLIALASAASARQGGPPGIVGAWKLDEASGTATADSSGAGNHGALRGAVWTTDPRVCRLSPCLGFDGIRADVLLSRTGSLGASSSFTVAAWVRPDALGREQTIVSGPGVSWSFDLTATNRLRLWSPRGGVATGQGFFAARTWRHVAVVKNGNTGANVAFYVDGRPDGTGTAGAFPQSNGPARIGSTDSRWWNGLLDDVQVWDRALSAAEIEAVVSGPRTPPEGMLRPTPRETLKAGTSIVVTDQVERVDVRRFGINLGGYNHWDSGQIMENLLHRNPGFEGQVFRSIVRCTAAGSTTWRHAWTGWPAGFWNGGGYESLQGTGVGRTGRLTTYARSGDDGVFTVVAGSTPPAVGDWVAVGRESEGGATTGWWTQVQGGGVFAAEGADLAPDSPGRQALRMHAPGAADAAELASHLDTWQGQTFLRLIGNHRLSFRAKGAGGTRRLQVVVRRLTNPVRTYVDRTLTLPPDWSDQVVDFSVSERADALGTLSVLFRVENGSTVLLDDTSLTNVDDDAANPTAFRLEVLHALKDLRPGIVRYWANQLGDTLDNQIADPFARRRSGFSFWSNEADQIEYGLHEFLALCEAVGAEPWYVVPTAFSLDEMRGLIEYLAGPAGTPYGDLRIARGRAAPWTEAFRRIHLELGNETWNPLFGGGTIEVPEAYGQRGDAIFGTARSSPWFVPERFDLILGGQAVWVQRNQSIHDRSSQHDSLALAPYLLGKVDRFAQPEEFYGPLLAEPELIVRPGATCPSDFHCNYMRRNHDAMQASSRPVELSVYEVNLHTTEGAITADQQALDRYVPSLGAGLAVANHMLLLLRELGIRNQALFALHQFAYTLPNRNTVRLWGTVRDLGATNRRRPQFHALRLANQALHGNLVRTLHRGEDPTWDQPAMNGVVLQGAHYLHSFAFVDGTQRALIVMNLHRTDALAVSFEGPGCPQGTVELRRLSGPSLASSEEDEQELVVGAETLRQFEPEEPLSLPPASMTVLLWETGGALPFRRTLTTGVPRVGGNLSLALSDPENTAGSYVLALASSTRGFPFARGLRIPLSPDALYWSSMTPPFAGLTGSQGPFDGQGRANAWLAVPDAPALEGVRFHSAFVSISQDGTPFAVTDPYELTIQR
jgi:hypothetical protein